MNNRDDRRILDLFGIDLPIPPASMAGVSTSELAWEMPEEELTRIFAAGALAKLAAQGAGGERPARAK